MRPSIANRESREVDNLLGVEPGGTLIGAGGRDEAIAKAGDIVGQGRADDLADELSARGHEQQRFAADVHVGQIVVEQRVADTVADHRAARIASANERDVLRREALLEQLDLGPFAGPVHAVEDDELAPQSLENRL